MSHVPHDLYVEFAEDAALLHALKRTDTRFQRIEERYHAINREIHRIESDIAPASDQHLEGLKKQRLALLDAVAGLIARAKAGSPA